MKRCEACTRYDKQCTRQGSQFLLYNSSGNRAPRASVLCTQHNNTSYLSAVRLFGQLGIWSRKEPSYAK